MLAHSLEPPFQQIDDLQEGHPLQTTTFDPLSHGKNTRGLASEDAFLHPASDTLSPTLPPLPRFERAREASNQTPARTRSYSSTYYAAAWGSPYATPSPPRPALSGKRANTLNGEVLDSSPTFVRSVGPRSSFHDFKASSRAPTLADKNNPYWRTPLTAHPFSAKSERPNWLSDSESEAETATASAERSEKSSDHWLDISEDSFDETHLITPTLRRFRDYRTRNSQRSGIHQGHRSEDSCSTVKPDNIWAHHQASKTIAATIVDRQAQNSQVASRPTMESPEKPLPGLPAESRAKDAGSIQPTDESEKLADPKPRPSMPTGMSFQRPKKRVVWKGKACIIALPLDDQRGSKIQLLSRSDIEIRLKKWESEGFDTRGFVLDDSHHDGGQSCAVYPDPKEMQVEHSRRQFRVTIPNKAEWDAWIRQLKEEKLRALGVTFGDEEPPRHNPSPFSGTISHSSSYHPGLPISPPNAASTASSRGMNGAHPFTPASNMSTNPSTQIPSGPSPFQPGMNRGQPAVAIPLHEKRGESPFRLQTHSAMPGFQRVTSPPGYFTPQAGGVSPMAPANLKNLGEVLSPVSPFPSDEHNISPQPESMFHQMRRQQDELQEQFMRQQQQNSARIHAPRRETLNRTPAFNEIVNLSNVEIAHPTPRSHNRNVSEALERDVDAVEDSLERAIRKQLQSREGAMDDHREIAARRTNKLDGSLSNEPSSSRSEAADVQAPSLQKKDSELSETSESKIKLWGLPKEGSRSSHKPPGLGHRSKPSAVGLNVEAKEFVFNPKASFTPANFSFSGSEFEPSAANKKLSKPTSTSSFGTTSGFNVAAPAFTPATFAPPEVTKSEFKFGSGLKVDAPEFNPTLPGFGKDKLQRKEEPAMSGPRIFDDFKLEGPAKANRRSKAIPIVRPDDSENDPTKHDEHEEDEEGRVGQSEALRKRARRFGSDREFTPASPASPPLLHDNNDNVISQGQFKKDSRFSPSEKENQALIDIATSDSEELPQSIDQKLQNVPDVSAHLVEETRDIPVSVSAEPEVKTKPLEDVANGMDDVEKARSDLEDGELDDLDVPSSSPRPESKHKYTRSSLSAAARPFEPRFVHTPEPQLSDVSTAAQVGLGQEAQKHSVLSDESADSRPEPRGLAASRFADHSIDLTSENRGLAASRFANNSVDLPPRPNGLPASQFAENSPDPKSTESELEASRFAASPSPDLVIEPEKNLDAYEAAHRVEGSLSSQGLTAGNEGLEHDSQSSETDVVQKLTEPVDSVSVRPSFALTSPSFEEIDAVMKQLNEAHSELGIERSDPILPPSSPLLRPPVTLRSDAPSPSPKRIQPLQPRHVPEESTEIDVHSPHYPLGLGIQAPVHHLNKHMDEDRTSDWNDMLESSADEEKFHGRSQYFDSHVDHLVGGIIERRLGPLERTLEVMQRSLSLMASGRPSRIATEVELSDADDEDEEAIVPYRSRSPNRKQGRSNHDDLRKTMLEALETHRETAPKPTANVDLSRMYEVLAEMKMLAEPAALQDRAAELRSVMEDVMSTHARPQGAPGAFAPPDRAELKTVVEDVISTHPRLRGIRVNNDHENGVDKLKLQIDGLETMLKLANERADEEYRGRRMADDEHAETKRLLRLAEEEAAQHRESSEEAERSLHEFALERKDNQELHHEILDLSSKNAALEATLKEYRLSHDQWKSDIYEERLKAKELRGTLYVLRKQIEEGAEARQGLRVKFERLQEDMIQASREIANDHAAWMRKEQRLEANIDQLQTALYAETQAKQHSQGKVQELLQDQEAFVKTQLALESSNSERAKAHETLAALQAKHEEHLYLAQNSQADLQNEIARLKNDFENAVLDTDRAKARQEALVDEAIEAKREALLRASESKETTLQEQSTFHERALNDLRERHARALHNSSEDRQRADEHYQEKMDLANQKIGHLEEKNAHLEERLEVTKAAARAAAEAATSRGVTVPDITSPPRSSMASMPFARGTDIPEKISPQALRESIMVLQDQLQNREQTIEHLEHELSQLDKAGPEKLKAKETEITWLRELLGVRIDDLDEVIATLSETNFDRQAARDAAIRLKANLQMEQQVRERASAASSTTPSTLSQGISTLASQIQSPRGLPMAAAAAWGNWRKSGKDLPFSSALSDIASIGSQTPSKSTGTASPQSFLSGLLTPPATSQRRTPTSAPSKSVGAAARPLRGYGAPPRSLSSARNEQARSRPLRGYSGAHQVEPPKTPPPLLRDASYDRDADADVEQDRLSAYGDGEGDEDAQGVVMGRGGEVRIGSPS